MNKNYALVLILTFALLLHIPAQAISGSSLHPNESLSAAFYSSTVIGFVIFMVAIFLIKKSQN